MEYVETFLKSIEMLNNIWSCIRDFFNYKRVLEENQSTLKRKLDKLSGYEEDINAELENAKYVVRKKQRKEAETWLKNVQQKRSEVEGMEKNADHTRYFSRPQFLRLVESNIKQVDELIEEGKFLEGIFIDVHQDREEAFVTAPLVGQSVKEIYLRKIWACLIDDGITSIGVYGMGGVGKTTIVTHIHKQLLKSIATFDHVYWVTVSQESSIHKLQDSIVKVMQLNFSGEQDERKRAAQLFKELTKRKKFVLILDDMWTHFPPEDVGIPIGVNAGKLIVTSRSLKVCQRMNCQQNIQVQPLPTDEAWDLFMKKLGHDTLLTPEVEEIARSIAKECAGLPLAIITTAGSMKGVDDIREWRNALNELREPTKGVIDLENEVFNKLKFSYDRLSDENLQKCFLYCALFPEDYNIQREYLIVYWIAEGLIDEMKTRQAEFDKGHALLNKLENTCLLERTTDYNGEICVKLHDVVRDMALKITRVNPQFMVKAGVQLMELPDEKEWSKNLERVSLMHNDIKGQLSSISPRCPRLCTLMLQSNRNIEDIPNSLFVYMQNLKVLDLSQNWSIECLPDSVSNLEELRALLLNDCRNLRHIPSLAKLTKLRELDLSRTQIEELPHGMDKLVNLKRLDLYHRDTAFVFPSGILLKLSHLQSVRLLLFKITYDEHVEEILCLKKLEVLVAPFYNLHAFNSYVKKQNWQKLTQYHLRVVSSHDIVSDEIRRREVHMSNCNLIGGGEDPLVLPTNIQEFNIFECNDLSSLSDISSSLKNARELKRCWIDGCSKIEHLWSWSIPSLEEEESASSLQSLRTLMLSRLPKFSVLLNFKGVGIGGAPPKSGTFSNLKLFSVGQCENLKYVFTPGLLQYHVQNLEVIHVYECSEMENIILAEEKGEQEEIELAEEEDIDSIIKFPKLRSLELQHLPKLKSIWRGTMVCHSLQQIEVRDCLMLKRLPISLYLNADTQTSPPLLTLKTISGQQEWWDSLEWDHAATKSGFQSLFDTKKIRVSNSDSDRAEELWWQDSERYEN